MQIQLLQNNQIDKARWLQTIQQSPNGLIYAWPDYLDAMSPGWQALVTEDYSFVMPLTVRKKWGIRYLYQPAWCQQLGIFSKYNITNDIILNFLILAKRTFRFGEININFANISTLTDSFLKKNYVLPLNTTYNEIRKHYSHELIKKNLNRVEKFTLNFTITSNINLAIKTYQKLYSRRLLHVSIKDYEIFHLLCVQLQKTDCAFVGEVHLPNGELLSCGLFLKDDQRIYNLASSTLPNGRKLEANHFLFDRLIQHFAGSGLLLDFEGSEIQNIERFYLKFGAVNQSYVFTKWNRLPWPLRLLKK